LAQGSRVIEFDSKSDAATPRAVKVQNTKSEGEPPTILRKCKGVHCGYPLQALHDSLSEAAVGRLEV